MSDETTYHVWIDSRQKGSSLLFLLYLAQQADDWGYCFPSMNRISERIRMSERAVRIIKQKLLNTDPRKAPVELRIFASAGPRSPDILQVICGLSEKEIRESEKHSPIAQAVKAGKSFQEVYATGVSVRGAKIAPLSSRGEKITPLGNRGENFAPLVNSKISGGKNRRGEKIAPNLKAVVVNQKQQHLGEKTYSISGNRLSQQEEQELNAILEGVGFQGRTPDFILTAMCTDKRMIRSWYYNVVRLEGKDRKYMGGRFRTGVESGRMAPGWKDLVFYQNKQVMRCDVPVGEDS